MISRRNKRVILGLVFGVVVLVLILAILNQYFAALELRQRLEEERAEIREPPPLLHEVERDTLVRTRRFAARVRPWTDATLAVEVVGRVERIRFDPGDRVEKGEVLLRVEDTLARLRVRSMESSLSAAAAQEREYRRQLGEAARLVESRAIPGTRLEEARSRVEVQHERVAQLEAELEEVRELLRRHEVRAPFAGIAGERLVEEGDTVSANQPVLRLAVLDPLRVVFYAGQGEIDFLTPGTEVGLRLPGLPEVVPSRLHSAGAVADTRTGTFRLEALLPNPEHRFRGGLSGTAEAAIELFEDRLFVPSAAVRYEGAQPYVYVAGEDGNARRAPIEVGPEFDGRHPVLSGLEAGQTILIR